MLIPVFNPTTEEYEKSYLALSYNAGVTGIQIKNTDRFVANQRIMIGEMGQEKTEVVTVSAVSADGNTLTIGATLFGHSADDPVYILQFDQVKYYRSTTGSTGTYTLLTTVALDVDNENLQTIYDDTTGVSTYYYKVSMYHSVSTLESALSDPIPGGGFSRKQVGYIVDEVLQELGDIQEQHVTRNEIIGYMNDVNDDLTISVSKPYDFLSTRRVDSITQGQNYLAFPTDSNGNQIMWKFDRMDYNYVDTTTTPVTNRTYTLIVWPEEEFRNRFQNNAFDSTNESNAIQNMCLDTAVDLFRFDTAPLTTVAGVLYTYYWKYFTQIDSEGDTIETPTAKIYKLYIKARYYDKRSIINPALKATAQQFETQYQIEKANYKKADRKDAGTARSFRPESSTVRGYRR